MIFAQTYLQEVVEIAQKLDSAAIEKVVEHLAKVREREGRLFILGVGGSAANASHAVNDFRKIAGIECYAPTDNVSELTARTNDEGWATVFSGWLKGSHLNQKDALLIFSVGGGNAEKNVSPNLVEAIKLAKQVGATVLGIVGRDGGYTAQAGDAVIIVPTVHADRITPHSEAFQGVIWHLFVSHPAIKSFQPNGNPLLKPNNQLIMNILSKLPIKIFADGADRAGMVGLYENPMIQGMTTNPTLMRKAGLTDYESFAHDILKVVKNKPISFEVFSDDFSEMHRQALKISAWQENVYVKIPITNTKGESALPLVKALSSEGVRLNVTAHFDPRPSGWSRSTFEPRRAVVVSVFAGRIADTGVDPTPMMKKSLEILKDNSQAELLWASVREVLNIFQAAECGAHIVTVTHDILAKAQKMAGMDLADLRLIR